MVADLAFTGVLMARTRISKHSTSHLRKTVSGSMTFQTYQDAKLVIHNFFHDYTWNRPHLSLKYMTPKEFYAMINGGSN